jgi:hypothetical protein
MTDSTLQAIEVARRVLRGELPASDLSVIETDFIHAIIELAGGRPNTIDRLRVNEGDYIRAAGDTECAGTRGFSCGLPYYDHPVVPGFEWLHRTCDGRFVKL